jgi:hypothetical protein
VKEQPVYKAFSDSAIPSHEQQSRYLEPFTSTTLSLCGRLSAEAKLLAIQYSEILLAEAEQCVACNAIHSAPSRLARWLIYCSAPTASAPINCH